MAMYVKIHYGPHQAFHTTSHKPQKLKGVRNQLRRLGYRVDLNPVDQIDCCIFEISGYQVFRCNIRNLQFNRESESDPVAQRAVAACLVATDKLMRARLHFWLWNIVDESIFMRTHTSRDRWPTELHIKQYPTSLDCINCCGILTRQTDEKAKLNYKEIRQNMLYDLSGDMEHPKADNIGNSSKLQ